MRIAILVAVLGMLPACPAYAECIHYEDYLHWETMVTGVGPGYGVTAAGDYLYVAGGTGGLRCYTTDNPRRFAELGRRFAGRRIDHVDRVATDELETFTRTASTRQ